MAAGYQGIAAAPAAASEHSGYGSGTSCANRQTHRGLVNCVTMSEKVTRSTPVAMTPLSASTTLTCRRAGTRQGQGGAEAEAEMLLAWQSDWRADTAVG